MLAPLPSHTLAALLLTDGAIWLPHLTSPIRGSLAIGPHGAAEVIPHGDLRSLLARTGPSTRTVALEGRLVTPGLHDAHIHVSEGGISLLRVDCRDARSDEEVAARAAARARELGAGRWVTGRGWDHHLFPGERWPRRTVLDAAVPDHPALLRRIDGHAAWANARALAAAGIARGTPDPEGGRIGRDPGTGEPDGLLFENAIDLVMACEPPVGDEDRERGLLAALRRAREVGVTSVDDERGWPENYARVHEKGELTARARIWGRLKWSLDECREWRASFARFPAIHAPRPGAGAAHGSPLEHLAALPPLVRPGLLKGYLDGSLGSRTAWFHEPYADDASTSGICTFDPDELRARVLATDADGFQTGLHAIGDRAITLALDVFEAARAANGPRDARHRIEHAQNVRDADVPRFAALQVVASMQPSHRTGDAGFFRQRLGAAREPGAYAWRRLLDAGAPVAFGSDFPVESMDPRTSLAPAIEGGLSHAEALRGFTTGAAWAGFLEREPLRDFVVWGDDLFRLGPEGVARTPVHMTVFDGRIVFERS